MNRIGVIDIARAAIGIMITDGTGIMSGVLAGIGLTCRHHGNKKHYD